MSTKCTIIHNNDPKEDFHFYKECFDEDNVYLQINKNCKCGDCNCTQSIVIPKEIMKKISKAFIQEFENKDLLDKLRKK